MQNPSLFQQFESQKHLLRITSDSFDVDATILAVLLEDFPEVHGKRFHDHTQVSLVEEVTEETKAVELVFWISVVKAFEDLQLSKTCLVPAGRVIELLTNVYSKKKKGLRSIAGLKFNYCTLKNV